MEELCLDSHSVELTAATLASKFVGDISGVFRVPGYQRGYRWDTTDVDRLLNDIWQALKTAELDQPYNLQPIVVKQHSRGSTAQTCQWELVDGQQRLTTIYLILLYMHKTGLNKAPLPYSLHYETRPGSAIFLERLGDEELDDYDSNIDYFHFHRAYRCIGKWFDAHGARIQFAANKFYEALFEKVAVIWYQAPQDMDATALFTRLNVGRIPLTDAELVKALLLSRIKVEHAHRAAEVASQWDIIERDLHAPELWGFICGNSPKVTDRYPTRISLLLDSLVSGSQARKSTRYHTFESLRPDIETDSLAFWLKILNLHDLMLGWFNNRNLFHKVGYLVLTGTDFGELARLSANQSKRQFEQDLDHRIQESLRLKASDVEALSYDDRKDYDKLLHLLLLVNVETMRRVPHANQRFPFHMHTDTAWSLEHIHAQDAENLTKAEQWQTWLRLHLTALNELAPNTVPQQSQLLEDLKIALEQVCTAQNFGNTFQDLASRVVAAFNAPDEQTASAHGLHSIANLALLSRSDNSLLSNAVFEAKRQMLLDVDRKGGYIPVCTRNVFLKYYTPANAHQNHFWGPQDRNHYLDTILEIAKPYFLNEEKMA